MVEEGNGGQTEGTEWSGSKKWSWAGFDEVERRGERDKKVNKIINLETCVLGDVVMSVLSVVF